MSRSFFDRLTGGGSYEEEVELNSPEQTLSDTDMAIAEDTFGTELSVDVYQTPDHIVIQAMVAGVDPGDLDVQISRDMVTIRGTRRDSKSLSEDDYFYKELYWGSFSRTILLPAEIEVEEAEAIEDHGLVTLKLPKVDKDKKTKLKIKASK